MPRVFVLSSQGLSASFSGGFDPLGRALRACEQRSQKCRVYAVDDYVTWTRPTPAPHRAALLRRGMCPLFPISMRRPPRVQQILDASKAEGLCGRSRRCLGGVLAGGRSPRGRFRGMQNGSSGLSALCGRRRGRLAGEIAEPNDRHARPRNITLPQFVDCRSVYR